MTNVNYEDLKSTGENVQYAQDGSHLILVIDLGTDIGLSASGKMNMIATTRGFQRIFVQRDGKDASVGLSLNLGEKVKK